ncbi:sensor histidine kinase [Actinomadura rupiterrae]|uniref:sensor histidine kinase n=1 Tax=Actinomadura rupiterrae TaxID=559627 RepID=UPI0020A5DE93|nr:histidine kinase [Actinomadura rupiterrae]MCP2339275.1 two-component system sensor histidine kinase DesK [Actinomadura rupiterrae]
MATVAMGLVSPVFTIVGTPGEPSRGVVLPALLGLALVTLQLRHSLAAARGERPPGWPWSLAGLAVVVYAPLPFYTYNWAAAQALMVASVAMLLRGRPAIVAAAVLALGTAVWASAWAAVLGSPVTWIVFEAGWWGLSIPMGSAALYGLARLTRAVGELRAAHTELAELAIAQERLRISRDVHDLIGQSLSAVSLRGDLALRLLETDPKAAQSEVATLTAVARAALRDLATVSQDGTGVDLDTEAAGARTLLAAAGAEVRIVIDVDGLPAVARTVYGWALREGVTNVLRHSAAENCSIIAAPTRLEIINDGVDPASSTPPGGGLTGLAERVRALSGRVTAGPLPGGRFRLRVDLPEEPT